MKKTLLILTLLTASLAAQAQVSTKDVEAKYREWIKTIASDQFGGRKPMTPYEDLTVNYLAGELGKLGLEPAFDGSWFQPFQTLSVTARLKGDQITLKGKKKAQLKYPDDLIIWTARATDKVELPAAEFVFCGFGIHAPEFGWFYRSDHYNFVKKGVPAVVMENGRELADPSKPDKYPMASWYHKPCDEYREDWDVSGTLANINMVFSVALSLAL